MDFISQFINTYHQELSPKSRAIFESYTKIKTLKKGDILVNEGKIQKKFYILKSGIIRSYVLGLNDKKHTRTIYLPISTSGSLTSLLTKEPSDSIYDCLTDVEILSGNFDAFIASTKENHEIALLYNKILESIFIRTEKRVNELSTLNATERYLKLKLEIPEIENLIPQYQIASYLNVSAVQLSRIRKEMYTK